MFVIRINPANSENLYSLFTIKIQSSLGKRAFIFILKILAIWNELRWMTEMNQFSWKHGVGRMEPAQVLVMLPISCFPCSQKRHQCMEDKKEGTRAQNMDWMELSLCRWPKKCILRQHYGRDFTFCKSTWCDEN